MYPKLHSEVNEPCVLYRVDTDMDTYKERKVFCLVNGNLVYFTGVMD